MRATKACGWWIAVALASALTAGAAWAGKGSDAASAALRDAVARERGKLKAGVLDSRAGSTTQDDGDRADDAEAKAGNGVILVKTRYTSDEIAGLVQAGHITAEEADAAEGRRFVIDNIVRLRQASDLVGADPDALEKAIRETLKGTGNAHESGKRIVVASGLELPESALRSKLTSAGLMNLAAELASMGDDGTRKKDEFWQRVGELGADYAVAEVVRDQLRLPKQATAGLESNELVRGAADIALAGGDARSAKAWVGRDLAQRGKITVDEFVDDYTDAADVDDAAQPADDVEVIRIGDLPPALDAFPKIGPGDPGDGTGPGPGAAAEEAGAVPGSEPEDEQQFSDDASFVYVDEVTPGSEPGSGTVTVDVYRPGEPVEHRTIVIEADGSQKVYDDQGNLIAEYPPGTGTCPSEDAEGSTYEVDEDTDGDGVPDKTTVDGEDDDNDNDDDNDDDDGSEDDAANQGDAAGGDGDDGGADGGGDAGNETPTPDSVPEDPAARRRWREETPFGRAETEAMLDAIGGARGGGFTDPADPESGGGDAGRAAFESSKLGGGLAIRLIGGAVDYAEEPDTGIVLDRRQLLAIALAAGGGGASDPERELGPKIGVAPGHPILPGPGIVGGGGTKGARDVATGSGAGAPASGASAATIGAGAGSAVSGTTFSASLSDRVRDAAARGFGR